MNKHAKTLRAILVLLPAEARQNYGPQILAATDELDRLEAKLTKHKDFAQILSRCAGGMVNGNRLAAQAKELLKQS